MAHEQAAAFALDALPDDEAQEFERHLVVCPECTEALEPLRATAAALAFAGALAPPPPGLRLRVLDVRGGVVVPLARRWSRPAVAVAAAAAVCAGLVVALQGAGTRSVAGLKAYELKGGSGSLLVADTGEATLVVRGLPPAAAGTVYELWIVRGGRARSAGFLHRGMAVLTRPVPRAATVAVSLEPTGGSRRPTGPLLIRAETA